MSLKAKCQEIQMESTMKIEQNKSAEFMNDKLPEIRTSAQDISFNEPKDYAE